MAEDAKTYVFGNDSGLLSSVIPLLQQQGIDPGILALMKDRDGGFGEGGWFMWIIFLFFLMGWGGFGYGNGRGIGLESQLNNDYGRDLLMQAINGNGTAISQLSSSLNCSTGQIQAAINAVGAQVQSVGNTVGLSGQQVINAIQAGNQTLASQLAQCCCENKLLTTSQGYEAQIRTLEQTNQLGSKIDGNTAAITAAISNQTALMDQQFCAIKERELQSKIDMLTATNTALQNSISNANQTAQIQAYVSSLVTPLQTEVTAIKNSMPATVAVQYPNLTAIPSYLTNGAYGTITNPGLWA